MQNFFDFIDFDYYPEPEIGMYAVGYIRDDGTEAATQGDVHIGDTWNDFYDWLKEDLAEDDSNVNRCTYVSYAGADLALARELWEEFGDVPIDDADGLLIGFNNFNKGQSKFDVWEFFEETFGVSIAEDLMK